jgi:hypothetical protein
MKKLIAISVMIALIAGAVFADTSIGGSVEVRLALYNAEFGDHEGFASGDIPKTTTNGSFGGAAWVLRTANDDGTLNGMLNWRNIDAVRGTIWGFHRVFINWKPDPMLNIFLGIDNDGKFATDALEGWGFHQGSCDYTSFQWWDYWRAPFQGNWDGFGAAISLYPAPGVDVNLIIPFGKAGWPQSTDASVNMSHESLNLFTSGYRLQANFAIPDIGKVMFSYKGPYNTNHFDGKNDLTFFSEKKDPDGDGDVSKDIPNAYGSFSLSFLMTGLVDGLQAHLGFGTGNIISEMGKNKEGEVIDGLPMHFGLGVHYAMGDFGVKFRAGFTLNMNYGKDHMFITGEIMPWYNLGFMSAFLAFGMSFDQADADADMNSGFFINPYVKVPIAGGYLHTGLKIRQHINGGGNVSVVTGDDYVRVEFPLIMGISF